MPKREEIIASARSYLGVRYHHQGRTRAGIDCAGLLVCVARDVGISTEDDQMGYSRTPDGRSLKQALDAFGAPVDAFQPGDFLLMRFDAQPQHIAIVTDVGIIHSYLSARRVVEHRLSEDWRARIVQAYAFPGVE
jgi:cell wall-associated NlpC family hydrolase